MIHLDYAGRPRWYRHRWIRRACYLLLALILSGIWWIYGDRILSETKRITHARAIVQPCLQHQANPDDVCFRRDYMPSGWEWQHQTSGQKAWTLQENLQALMFANKPFGFRAWRRTQYGSTVYLHERHNKNGSRLVIINISGSTENLIGFEVYVVDPSYWSQDPRVLSHEYVSFRVPDHRNFHIGVYAGREDSSSKSGFSFKYDCGVEERGVITGKLQDDDKVQLNASGYLLPR